MPGARLVVVHCGVLWCRERRPPTMRGRSVGSRHAFSGPDRSDGLATALTVLYGGQSSL
jgi:hypothetical protein